MYPPPDPAQSEKETVAKSESRTVGAYNQMKADILRGKFQPGAKLIISSLCEEIDVSLGAVREALSRLASDGLVMFVPQKGYRVAPISRQDLEDITIVRIDVERLCLERALKYGDLKWEAGILSAHHELNHSQVEDPDHPGTMGSAWSQAHDRFHYALVSACDSPWLLNLRANLYVQSQRYRFLSIPLDQKRRDIVKEHADLADAAIRRDISATKTLIADHFNRTTQILLEADIFD
jgi:DNA-binding GntR family transcriptional regulator